MSKKRHGGRKPGSWVHTTPEELREYRATHQLSRGRLAAMLGVSSTSVQNWESGKVASEKVQLALARVLQSGAPDLSAPVTRASVQHGSNGGSSDPVISTTGAIVSGYLRSRGKPVEPDELLSLIRVVREALS
jgi:DNA-binding transcriptional regulator YiaG